MLIGLLVVVGLAIAVWPQGDPGPEIPQDQRPDYQWQVVANCQNLVKEHLTSPGTMDVVRPLPRARQTSPGVWRYDFLVDSENGLGALLRSSWSCTVRGGRVDVTRVR